MIGPTWLADVVLAVGAIEALTLLAVRRRLRLAAADIAGLLVPGAALAIALRITLANATLVPLAMAGVAVALLVAGLMHGFDLCRRVRHAPPPPQTSAGPP